MSRMRFAESVQAAARFGVVTAETHASRSQGHGGCTPSDVVGGLAEPASIKESSEMCFFRRFGDQRYDNQRERRSQNHTGDRHHFIR